MYPYEAFGHLVAMKIDLISPLPTLQDLIEVAQENFGSAPLQEITVGLCDDMLDMSITDMSITLEFNPK